jgi:3-hydroxyisobutyrate dehydrogenase-like beta-hydroxyacid dehydrogenase
MKVGFIGLGAMGAAIASNILKAGHEVTVWNRSPGPARRLAEQGATAAHTPEECLQGEMLYSMLASDAAIHDVGLDGPLLEKAAKGLLHVNMATMSVEGSRGLHKAHAERGLHYISSPVFGRPEVAAAAKLTIIAAGAASDIERARPILEKLGQRFAVVGNAPEQANLFKLAGNFMIMSAIESIGEAVALLRKGGVDPAVFVDVLTNGLFACPAYQIYGKIVVEQKYEPAGFKLRWGYKDAGLVLAAAKDLQAPMPAATLVHDHYLEAMANGLADKDWSLIADLAAGRAGLPKAG